MPDAEFETMVKSILVNLEAKDKNLSEEHSRMYGSEIAQHRYQFDRQQTECEILKTIKKEEWQKHFEDLTHTELRRVDFRYNSETHK
jgi:secreted Zn-dependent insulinase-like peptidase